MDVANMLLPCQSLHVGITKHACMARVFNTQWLVQVVLGMCALRVHVLHAAAALGWLVGSGWLVLVVMLNGTWGCFRSIAPHWSSV